MSDMHTAIINRIATRVWRDNSFRELIFSNPTLALIEEFGEVPSGFDNVVFKARPVDRVSVHDAPSGRTLRVRAQRSDEPLSAVTRHVFGVHELVVVFYTKRCQYQCAFCTLPSTSAYSNVSTPDLQKQLEQAFAHAGDELDGIEMVSLGNEGSILDERTFSNEQLTYALSRCAALPSVNEIVLETRAEFVSEGLLGQILDCIPGCKLTLKIGLESVDDRIRNTVLGKKMDLACFESVVKMLGARGVGLATYVIVKADPAHSDEEGKEDARRTCEYLKNLCRGSDTDLTLKINTMYGAEGSAWARAASKHGWVPPSIFDLAEVMLDVWDDHVKVFAGLYDEGLATHDGHYEIRPDFEPWALNALERYNQTMDAELLRKVANHRRIACTAMGNNLTKEIGHGEF
jgi:radical SAM enzyme (TIGR01210 family)